MISQQDWWQVVDSGLIGSFAGALVAAAGIIAANLITFRAIRVQADQAKQIARWNASLDAARDLTQDLLAIQDRSRVLASLSNIELKDKVDTGRVASLWNDCRREVALKSPAIRSKDLREIVESAPKAFETFAARLESYIHGPASRPGRPVGQKDRQQIDEWAGELRVYVDGVVCALKQHRMTDDQAAAVDGPKEPPEFLWTVLDENSK